MEKLESARFPGKVPSWRHAKCFIELGWLETPVDELPGWDTLSPEDQTELRALAKPTNSKTGIRLQLLIGCNIS